MKMASSLFYGENFSYEIIILILLVPGTIFLE